MITIEFSAILNGGKHEWARYTEAGISGFGESNDGDDFSTHQVFRLFESGPAADDEGEEYIYVVRTKTGKRSGSAIIHFRCKYQFPEKVDSREPQLLKLEVVASKSIIK